MTLEEMREERALREAELADVKVPSEEGPIPLQIAATGSGVWCMDVTNIYELSYADFSVLRTYAHGWTIENVFGATVLPFDIGGNQSVIYVTVALDGGAGPSGGTYADSWRYKLSPGDFSVIQSHSPYQWYVPGDTGLDQGEIDSGIGGNATTAHAIVASDRALGGVNWWKDDVATSTLETISSTSNIASGSATTTRFNIDGDGSIYYRHLHTTGNDTLLKMSSAIDSTLDTETLTDDIVGVGGDASICLILELETGVAMNITELDPADLGTVIRSTATALTIGDMRIGAGT